MADPVLRLDNPRISVEPGGQAQVVVTIASASSIVEGFALDLVGADPVRWAEVIPPSVSVYPGSEATAVVVFSPPPGAAAQSGTFPFGVRARSTEDAAASAVVEGDITLGKVSGLQAKIVPVTSAGRWRGRHTIQLSNWGNAPVQLQLVASDPDAALGFYLRPDLVDLPIGGNATVRMTVRTRKPFMRGTPVRLPFQVIGEPAGAPPGPRAASPYGDPARPVVDGALNQKPILSKAFVTLAAVLLVGALAGGAYAFTRGPTAPPTSLEGLGPPEKPKNFTVVATGPESLKASWTPIAQITGYQILDIDPPTKVPRGLIPVNGSLGQTTIDKLTPDTEYCYRLQAQRDTKIGPLSDQVCARTAKPVASPSPTPSASATPTPTSSPPVDPSASPSPSNGTGTGNGQPGPTGSGTPSGSAMPDPLAGGAYALVAGTFADDGGASPVPANLVTKLQAQFPTAKIISSVQYPKLELSPGRKLSESGDWLLVVVGPYGTLQAAEVDRGRVGKLADNTVLIVQPDPPG